MLRYPGITGLPCNDRYVIGMGGLVNVKDWCQPHRGVQFTGVFWMPVFKSREKEVKIVGEGGGYGRKDESMKIAPVGIFRWLHQYFELSAKNALPILSAGEQHPLYFLLGFNFLPYRLLWTGCSHLCFFARVNIHISGEITWLMVLSYSGFELNKPHKKSRTGCFSIYGTHEKRNANWRRNYTAVPILLVVAGVAPAYFLRSLLMPRRQLTRRVWGGSMETQKRSQKHLHLLQRDSTA